VIIVEERKMLSIKEAAERIQGASAYCIRKLVVKGELPHKKSGKKYLIPEDALIKYFFGDEQGI
jgi:excisionase family DNA binding protein